MIDVYPATRVVGRIQVHDPAVLPGELRITGRARLAEGPGAELDFTVPVGEGGQLAFAAPSAPLDLRLAARDLAPAYRWDARPQDGAVDLGHLELVPGGSILGYVIDSETEYPVPGATVTALPADFDALGAPERDAKAGVAKASVPTDERGAFQLLALAPGAYRLRAEHPDYLTTPPADVRIVRDSETLLPGNLVLSPPLTLAVLIDPPVSPSGHPWRVELRADAGRNVVEATADAAGTAELGDLAAGSWRLEVGSLDVHGAYEAELELLRDQDLLIEIPLVEVHGRVTLGGDPVTGQVVLSPGAGGGWGATLDNEGVFRTWMREPKYDFLFATVLSEDLPSVAKLTVEDLEVRDGILELEIELLDLEFTGRVLDHRGVPVAAATITALEGTTHRLQKVSDRDGSFSIPTFHAAEYRVRASHETRGASSEEIVALGETFPSASVELVLRESRELAGLVTGPSGEPVSGAGVLALSAGTGWVEDNTLTDPEGRFTVEVAEDSGQAVLTVTARGYPFWSACIDANVAATLQLPPAGGELEVRVNESDDPSTSLRGQTLLVNENGGLGTLQAVYGWINMHGRSFADSPFRIPNVAPGRWSAVWLTEPWGETVRKACFRALAQNSEWVEVSPGVIATLKLDRKE